jgi:hypothetical protein
MALVSSDQIHLHPSCAPTGPGLLFCERLCHRDIGKVSVDRILKPEVWFRTTKTPRTQISYHAQGHFDVRRFQVTLNISMFPSEETHGP